MSDAPIRERLVSRIQATARRNLDASDIALFEDYVDQLVHIHTDESFLDWSDEDLYQVHFGLFSEVAIRQPSEALVKVFNPQMEAEGWDNQHTVIYFCHTDLPFLVDSLRMALNRLDLNIHLFESNPLSLLRDAKGKLIKVCETETPEAGSEDHGFIVVDSLTDTKEHKIIQDEFLKTIQQVSTIVEDFKPMLNNIGEVISEYKKKEDEEGKENLLFLEWLRDGNFTFLGVADFRFEGKSVV